MRIALLAAIPADIFAGRHFGAILGAAHGGGGGVGGFIGPFLVGWLFDITGNYQLPLLPLPRASLRLRWPRGSQ